NVALTAVMFVLLASCGTLFRWKLQNSRSWIKSTGTFIANVSSSFLLGILLAGFHDPATLTVLGAGFLGSFSTFSTVMMEINEKIEYKGKNFSMFYLTSSIVGGVLAALIGLEVGA
ncbi:MAG: CrcB family protein, partial [Acidimicrobiales bacterium]|nr:CrcB family protein [Acidimicrobiales bacterium]